MIRIAVLGCGRIGRMHVTNITSHPSAELAAVYDIHDPSAEAVSASSEVDAVLIVTVTDIHTDYIEKAVDAGKPVLYEEPIVLSLDRAYQCADAVLHRPDRSDACGQRSRLQ